jgi:hypothetical protein
VQEVNQWALEEAQKIAAFKWGTTDDIVKDIVQSYAERLPHTWYIADFYYPKRYDGPARELSRDLHLQAASRGDAVKDAVRWYRNRMQIFPEVFPDFHCIKVREFSPNWVDERGGLVARPMGMWFFEWKNDWGPQLDDYIEAKL